MSQSQAGRWAAYAFSVLRRTDPPALEGAPEALPGFRRLRAVPAGDSLWLILADAPRDRYGEGAIEKGLEDLEWVSRCAVAHERVVEHFMDQGTLLPLKLFSLFDDDRRVVSYFERIRPKLDAVLDRVQGCSEWGLWLSLNPASIAEARRKPPRPEATSGAGYLREKKAARDRGRRLEERAHEQAEVLYSRLAGRAVDSSRRTTPELEPGTHVLLSAAFLVADDAAEGFEEEVRNAAERLGESGIAVRLSGPWPPYHFVEGSA